MKNKRAMAKIGIAGTFLFAVAIAVILICSNQQVIAGETGDHNVTLEIGNTAPAVVYVAQYDPTGSIDPTSGTTTSVTIEVHVQDVNGIGDIDLVWSDYWYAAGGETNRSDTNCTYVEDLGSNIANYTCTADIYFYDIAGSWGMIVYANDTSSEEASNLTETFTYNSLQDISISVSTIQFGAITMGGSDEKADNDPQAITNEGNADIATVNVTGYNVKHLTEADNIPATDFKVGAADDCAGVSMNNAESLEITGVTIVRGSSSTDDMYYCIPTVPTGLANGNYAATSNWVVTSIV